MSRAIAFCFLLLAAVLGFLYIDSRPVWAPFDVPAVLVVEELPTQGSPVKKLSQATNKPAANHPQLDWLPDTGAASVHAASLIALKDGSIRAFWFAGSREGAPDVVINSAVYDSKSGTWGAPVVVMDRIAAEKGLSRYIAKLGNPVPSRSADGRLQLFFVTVSIGGWAGSSISTMSSDDEGISWSRPHRLITSPFANLSTLVKSPTIHFADGRLGLPAYHEWIGRFGEFLRIESDNVIDKRRMSSGRGAIQPIIFNDGAQQASAYFRQTRSGDQLKQIPMSETNNAGQTWSVISDTEIPNPNSAIAALTLVNGTRLLVLNNLEAGRHRLVLMLADPVASDKAKQWRVLQVLEDDEALPGEQRREFSYPYLITDHGNDAHLVYTWDRKKIRHIYFGSDWLAQLQSQLKDGLKEGGQ
jgi:predicted neuraminidase